MKERKKGGVGDLVKRKKNKKIKGKRTKRSPSFFLNFFFFFFPSFSSFASSSRKDHSGFHCIIIEIDSSDDNKQANMGKDRMSEGVGNLSWR